MREGQDFGLSPAGVSRGSSKKVPSEVMALVHQLLLSPPFAFSPFGRMTVKGTGLGSRSPGLCSDPGLLPASSVISHRPPLLSPRDLSAVRAISTPACQVGGGGEAGQRGGWRALCACELALPQQATGGGIQPLKERLGLSPSYQPSDCRTPQATS